MNAALEYQKTLDVIGQQIDEITYLDDIVIEDETITYKFLITDNSITSFTQQRRDEWENYICNSNKVLIDAGLVEFTLENVVLKNKELFDEDLILFIKDKVSNN